MANKNKIIICWNESKYADEIKSQLTTLGFEAELHREYPTDCEWKAKYLIILCELKWSHDTDNGSYSDLNGIKLVQHLRSKKNIKMPVLFVSFLSQKYIADKHLDKRIICTPALQHEFNRLPSIVNDWKTKLDAMKNMSELELQYTTHIFCDIEGMVKDLNHTISSCYSAENLNKKYEVLALAVEHKYRQFLPDLLGLKTKLSTLDESDAKAIENTKKCFRTICFKIIDD